MSVQGPSSSDRVERIEVYLDAAAEAVSVLTAPPFRFRLDTSALEEGDHTLRLVRIGAAGGRRERRVPFRVEHEPAMEIRGLEEGATVSGRIDVDVVTPTAAIRPAAPARGPSPWLYVLSTVVILGGIWVFFMLVPMYGAIVSTPGQTSATASAGSAAPVDQQLLTTGEQLYGSDCAACHKPSGEGMPPTFPALAGNSFLSDAGAVVKRIYDGAGSMPGHHAYTATQLAAVATYIRNTWGNGFGGVSVDEASSAVPQAAAGGGAPSPSSPSTPSAAAGGASAASSSGSSGAAAAPSSSSGSGPAAPSSSSPGPAAPSASSPGPASPSSPGSGQAAPSASSGAGAAAASSSSGAAAAAPATPASQAMQAGEKLYTSDCQSCHQTDGSGVPPTFPALAGNGFLSDPAAVVQRIYDGKGTMPPHPSYTAQDLADVATYIRSAFGNDYGPVSVQQVRQAVPKAAP